MLSGPQGPRIRSALLAAATLAVGIGVLLYRGPARSLVRGLGGDIAVVAWVAHCWGVIVPHRPEIRVLGAWVLAVVLEFIQLLELVGPDAPFVAHLVFGSTFDPVDIAAYTVSAGLGLGAEKGLAKLANRVASPS